MERGLSASTMCGPDRPAATLDKQITTQRHRLARHAGPIVLLHGDRTPGNILDGDAERGPVAIDPAPL
jgi:streptomycin 6-kinase